MRRERTDRRLGVRVAVAGVVVAALAVGASPLGTALVGTAGAAPADAATVTADGAAAWLAYNLNNGGSVRDAIEPVAAMKGGLTIMGSAGYAATQSVATSALVASGVGMVLGGVVAA